MKLNLRHAVWALALAFTVTVLTAPRFAAAFQSQQGIEHGRGHDKDQDNAKNDNAHYQQGWQHGQEDRANKHARRYREHFDNDADRRAYETGYNQGYTGQYVHNSQYGRPYPIGPGHRPWGDNIQNVAYNNGFQEGLQYGRTDRTTGHSNRPTYSSTYKKGIAGYDYSYGDRTQYRAVFQEGFREGYARGYNEGGYRR